MCSSLWNTNFPWRLCFHWIFNISDIWCHVDYHVYYHGLHAGLYNNVYFQVYHDILHRLKSISWKTVSRKFFTLIPVCHGGPLYLNIFVKMSVLRFVFFIAINNNGVSDAF